MTEFKPPVLKLREWKARTPDAPALHRRIDDRWECITWERYHEQSCRAGAALVALGHRQGECVVILSGNRVEWLYAQWGIMMAGGAVAPCYMTNPPDQVGYLVGHCRARFVFVEDARQLAKLSKVRGDLDRIEKAIVFDPDGCMDVEGASTDWVMDYETFLGGAGDEHREECERRLGALEPRGDAFIIYTSGTTGRPKAVAISHSNLGYGGPAILKHYPVKRMRAICYLPLCHIAEQSATNLAQLETGGEVFVCPDVALMPRYLPHVRPTTFFGVPRIWEKIEVALRSKFQNEKPRKRRMIEWAMGVEREAFDERCRTGKEPRTVSRWLARRIVIDRIKKGMGLDQVEYTLTGSAPISTETLRFFASLGFRVQEVYGLSETTGMLTATLPDEVAIGTVGKPLDGVEVRIAEDGEILARGPGLSRGYLHDPGATEELWEGGWMHTGDIGSFDGKGNLRITDRKKELIITAQAKKIAPQPIEEKLSRIRGVSQAVIAGDRRSYLVSLMTIDEAGAPALARELGIDSTEPSAVAADPRFIDLVQKQLDRINESLARYETVKRFAILPREFTIEAGELTPTLKVKRRKVIEKHADLIDAIYAR